MPVLFDDGRRFDVTVPVLVVGAGACGLTAALAARDAGAVTLGRIAGTEAARIGAK